MLKDLLGEGWREVPMPDELTISPATTPAVEKRPAVRDVDDLCRSLREHIERVKANGGDLWTPAPARERDSGSGSRQPGNPFAR